MLPGLKSQCPIPRNTRNSLFLVELHAEILEMSCWSLQSVSKIFNHPVLLLYTIYILQSTRQGVPEIIMNLSRHPSYESTYLYFVKSFNCVNTKVYHKLSLLTILQTFDYLMSEV
uniref:Uncharacterized protein n=1 Tax=Cacopsylla melanoneura TaxID=428564 RepID=A0A8D8SJ33_9HEMI